MRLHRPRNWEWWTCPAAVSRNEVVTNSHVVEFAATITVSQGRKVWSAVITHDDPENDLCKLLVKGLSASPVPLRPSSTLRIGEKVYAIGAPRGYELTLSEGLVSSVRKFVSTGRLAVQTSAAISPGSSGGGLFDSAGRLVGITTLSAMFAQNLNFALSTELISELNQHPTVRKMLIDAETQAAIDAAIAERDKALAERAAAARAANLRKAAELFERGNEALEKGEFEEALRSYERGISFDSDNIDALQNLGNVNLLLGRYEAATRAYLAVLDKEPDHKAVFLDLGIAYHKQSMRKKVLEIYQKLRALDPDMAEELFRSVYIEK